MHLEFLDRISAGVTWGLLSLALTACAGTSTERANETNRNEVAPFVADLDRLIPAVYEDLIAVHQEVITAQQETLVLYALYDQLNDQLAQTATDRLEKQRERMRLEHEIERVTKQTVFNQMRLIDSGQYLTLLLEMRMEHPVTPEDMPLSLHDLEVAASVLTDIQFAETNPLDKGVADNLRITANQCAAKIKQCITRITN